LVHRAPAGLAGVLFEPAAAALPRKKRLINIIVIE
jgi:hypothetical protein